MLVINGTLFCLVVEAGDLILSLRLSRRSPQSYSPVKIKPPPNVLFLPELRLMVWKPRGILNEEALNQLLIYMGKKEATFGEPFNRFSDAVKLDAIDLNFRYVFHFSLFRRLSFVGRPPVKSAILVAGKHSAHYSKLHELLTQGSPLKVRIFLERAKAAKWLGVSVESLEE